MNLSVSILYTLPTERMKTSIFIETDTDTVASAEEIAEALKKPGIQTTMVPLSEHSIEETISSIHADVIVNLIDWSGEDFPLSLRAMEALTKTHIPFTGGDIANFILAGDKVQMKKAFQAHDIPTPPFQVFETGDEPVNPTLRFPLIVKLATEHCSIGLDHRAIVSDEKSLRARVKEEITNFHQTVFAEEFIDGREFQVTVYETEGGLRMLPPAEIPFKVSGTEAFLTYDSRWEEESADFHTSTLTLAVLPDAIVSEMEKISIATFTHLGYSDYTRLDMRMRGEKELFVLEANCNPGLSDDDLYGMTLSYRAVGMGFSDFVISILRSCLRRNHLLDNYAPLLSS